MRLLRIEQHGIRRSIISSRLFRKRGLSTMVFASLSAIAATIAPSAAIAQVDYATQIQPIFNAQCVSCHGGDSGVYLNSYAATMSSRGDRYEMNIVVPGDAPASPLYDKLLPKPREGSRMPKGGSLTDAQIALIRDWINQGATEVATSVESAETPLGVALLQNHPNPFNPSTRITFTLPVSQHVMLEVWNLSGQRLSVLADGVMPAGVHTMTFDALTGAAPSASANGLASGAYLYRLVTADRVLVRAMTLVR